MTGAAANDEEGWASLWGPTDADTTNGFLGTGVVIPPASTRRTFQDSILFYISASSPDQRRFTYFAGAGWTRNSDFSSREDWHGYLSRFALSLQYPLQSAVSLVKDWAPSGFCKDSARAYR